MKVIILAAGKGTRIRPLSDSIPKPMLPVADRPLVAHTVDSVIDAGADEIVLVIGYLGDQLKEYFGSVYRGVEVRYVEQESLDGTAAAVESAQDHLDGAFAVINGDNLYEPNALDRLFSSGPAILSAHVDDPTQYGVLSTEEGTVTDIVEKPSTPPSNLANAGAYVFPEDAADRLAVPPSERGEREITDVLETVIQSHELNSIRTDRWMDVGRPWELLEANEWKLSEIDRRIDGEVDPSASIQGSVMIDDDATVRSGVVIDGPAVIHGGATIGPNAYIRGSTVLGRDVSIGHGVEVKNSIILDGSNVNHLSYVGDSILGQRVNFGAGTMVGNLRHDGNAIDMTVKGERVSTDRRKLGVIAGDDVKTGVNTSISPGVVMTTGARSFPGEVVDRDR